MIISTWVATTNRFFRCLGKILVDSKAHLADFAGGARLCPEDTTGGFRH